MQHKINRIYIPRIMTNIFNFYSDNHIKQFIYDKLSSLFNIRHIQLKWLDDAFDLSAFIYLHPIHPIKFNSIGKTAFCNLACNLCHSLDFYVFHNIFWKLLPFNKLENL
jgi:hypothetical protein